MKHVLKIAAPLLIAAVCFSLMSFEKDKPANKQQGAIYSNEMLLTLDSRKLEANNISTWFRNNGSFNRDPSTGNSGFEWPKGSAKFARYASGLWIGAVVGGDTLVCIAEYDYEYLPGYVDNNGIPQGQFDPNYRIYNISTTDSSDYQYWRTIASGQGAYLDSSGNPYLMGAQTMFYSYTDGYPEAHGNNAGQTAPLKAQILQTNWGYNSSTLREVIFTEFRVINRSNQPWINTYLCIWTDDDLGNANDDAVGCDSTIDLVYTYNFAASDLTYGGIPPAVGTRILRSPIRYTGNMGDTVKYYSPPGSQRLVVKVGYKYTGTSSFNTYINGDPTTGDPGNYIETYYNLQGLKRNGTPWINPFTSVVTKFPFSGNPESGTGWIMTDGNDRRSMQSFGPVTVNPGDTQSIIIAQMIARNVSNLQSVAALKTYSNYVKNFYDNNFIVSVQNISSEVPESFELSQNYPNPFNPKTIINYQLRITNLVKLTVYDVLGHEVAVFVNEKQAPGTYQVEFDGSGLSSGVYFYKLVTEGFTDVKRMMLLK
jgi:hypothetical protein